MLRTILLSLALSGCGWSYGSNHSSWGDPLWEPTQVVALEDAVFVHLTNSGKLARVTQNGADLIALEDAFIDVMFEQSLGDSLVVKAVYTRCVSDDPRDTRGVKTVDDCPTQYRVERSELAIIGADGAIGQRIPIGNHHNALGFSNDGRWAVAWFDPALGFDAEASGVVDLTSVLILDLQATGADIATSVSVGFGADSILFSEDSSRAIVLSKDAVVTIDLSSGTPQRGARYSLTLDPDQSIDPVGVQLTQDGAYAVITAAGQDDLYALRLENPAINLVNLSGTPSAMSLLPDLNDDASVDDASVIVHANSPRVDFVDHDTFDVETYDLDEGMDAILMSGRQALLWSRSGKKDVYTIDHDTGELTEFRLENPPVDVQLTPGGEFAVVLSRPEGSLNSDLQALYDRSPVLEILEVGSGRGRSASAKLLDGIGLGVAFSKTESRLDVLVLQQDEDYLYQLDIYTDQATEVAMKAPPARIGTLPDGGFWITHEAGLGLVSFYDPETGAIKEVGGFAAAGLGIETPLAANTEEGQ